MANDNEGKRVTVTGRYIGGGIFEPREDAGGKERYNAIIALDEGQEKKVNQAVKAAKTSKWGDKKVPGLTVWGVREGDDPDFANTYEQNFINAKATRKPSTVRKINGAVHNVEREDDVIYPGCYVAVSIDAYAMEGDKAKSIPSTISLSLRGMMFRANGERIGDYVDADSEFGEFGDSEDPVAAGIGGSDDDDGLGDDDVPF